MIGAIDQGRGDIDHREAQRSTLKPVNHPLLHRGDILARHYASGDRLVERKACAAWQRLDIEYDIAELTVSARLLLMAATLDDASTDGFAITDGRLTPIECDAEARGESLGRHPQVHFALSPDDDFVSF